jgi:hypothetical protein
MQIEDTRKDTLVGVQSWANSLTNSQRPDHIIQINSRPDHVHLMFIVTMLQFLLPEGYAVTVPDSQRDYVPIYDYTGLFEVTKKDSTPQAFWLYGDERGWHLLSATRKGRYNSHH